MTVVRAKKNLGQHFLTDINIAKKIVGSLSQSTKNVLEIGPGTGVLSQFLFELPDRNVFAVDVDRESVDYLQENFPENKEQVFFGNFLKMNPSDYFNEEEFSIIGNFPYNISSQILFRVLELRNRVPEVVGMIQKEVAERIAAPPGSKTYGILSVLLQAFYDIEYLFTVNENVFNPPPKVKSAVIRLRRNETKHLDCDEKLFRQVVKTTFNQRRKMIRNSIKPILGKAVLESEYLEKRPEQLSVEEFVTLTNQLKRIQEENHEV